jgi:hypothetical protein
MEKTHDEFYSLKITVQPEKPCSEVEKDRQNDPKALLKLEIGKQQLNNENLTMVIAQMGVEGFAQPGDFKQPSKIAKILLKGKTC